MWENDTKNQNPKLWFLFWSFLKIGSYSFGGYMALIAVIKKEFVERKKIISDEEILDGLSLASFLPGPVAVNTVVYIGYTLRGIKGAMVSMTGVLLPTFILVTGFSIYYFQPNAADIINPHIAMVLPVVVAIITDVGIKMAKKQITSFGQIIIALGAFFMILFWASTWAIGLSLLMAGTIGLFLYKEKVIPSSKKLNKSYFKDIKPILAVLIATIVLFTLLALFFKEDLNILINLSSVFASMSLSLFGGGYVIIPIIENVIVNDLAWLSISEFNASLSISQITPGPILISAAFIGYKMAGIPGAVISTISIFLPSGMLMIILGGLHHNIKESTKIKAILIGLRAAVIGLIASAAFSIGYNTINNKMAITVFSLSLLAFYFNKMHPAIVIIITLIIGIVWHNLL